jgi:CheY-like chemotaxis protein
MENILVVDDDRLVLALIKHILEREGIVTHCVSSGEEALEKIKERSFSLMITDLNMPGLDGFELSRKGREMAPQMPIIMNTGGISQEIICQAREVGIAKVMNKPFFAKEMLETIRDVMANWQELASSKGKRREGMPAREFALIL